MPTRARRYWSTILLTIVLYSSRRWQNLLLRWHNQSSPNLYSSGQYADTLRCWQEPLCDSLPISFQFFVGHGVVGVGWWMLGGDELWGWVLGDGWWWIVRVGVGWWMLGGDELWRNRSLNTLCWIPDLSHAPCQAFTTTRFVERGQWLAPSHP